MRASDIFYAGRVSAFSFSESYAAHPRRVVLSRKFQSGLFVSLWGCPKLRRSDSFHNNRSKLLATISGAEVMPAPSFPILEFKELVAALFANRVGGASVHVPILL